MVLPDTASMQDAHDFNARFDAQRLMEACKGRGADKNIITEILARRSWPQREAIVNEYRTMYQEDLISVLLKDLSGDYENVVMLLAYGPIYGVARELRKKLDANCADEILCCANNWELREIQEAYNQLRSSEEFRKDKHALLTDAISSKFKDGHGHYLMELLKIQRDEIPMEDLRREVNMGGNLERFVDRNRVEQDVTALHNAADPKAGKPKEDILIDIISKRSNLHLKNVYDRFSQMYQTSLVDYLAKGLKKNALSHALNTSIMAAVDYKLLLIAQLNHSMKGLGTNENSLSRILALRSEYDLELLKTLFEERIGSPLDKMVSSETSGDYKEILLVLLNSKLAKSII